MASSMNQNNNLLSRQFEMSDSIEGVFDFFEKSYEAGWTDGLPVYPPLERNVREMLRYTDRDSQDVIGRIPPRNGIATVEKIAINAVMAGCRPEYLPILSTAVGAMLEPAYNLYGRQTTTHPGAHLLIIHGPIRKELDVNCRNNVFGHGWRANATMGRALRLIMINIGGNKPGVTDMATHGHPGKYSYCMGEDEENSPWQPFHTERGMSADTSAVTVVCAEAPHNINDGKSMTPERYLGSAAGTMAIIGGNALYRSGLPSEQMLVIPAETANWIHDKGWSKERVKKFIYDNARRPVRELRDRGGWDMAPFAPGVDPNDDDCMVPIVGKPEDLLVLVAGGDQRHMNAILTSGYNLSVSRPITLKDGTPIRSVQDYLAK
jgi:hypothetical protein